MRLEDLDEVNRLVNNLPYKSDPPGFDDWSPIDETGGDCDSYAVAKFRRLAERGWPPSGLRLACCYVEPLIPLTARDLTLSERNYLLTGLLTMAQIEKMRRYHCVLIASSESGDWMLDNRFPNIVPVRDLPAMQYEPHCIQGPEQTWVPWVGVTTGESQ